MTPELLFKCPTCGGWHFNITVSGKKICASVSKFTDHKVREGGCGWKEEILVVKLGKVRTYKDGGTKEWLGDDNQTYFEDYRIASRTKGAFYNKYPSNFDAKLITDVKLIKPDEKSI